MSHLDRCAGSKSLSRRYNNPLLLFLLINTLPSNPYETKMTDPDPWTALLATASQPPAPKKHLVICGEPSAGKRTILRGLVGKSRSSVDGLSDRNNTTFGTRGAAEEKEGKRGGEGKQRGPLRLDVLADPRLKPTEGLILGYEYIDISPSESGTSPPLSSPSLFPSLRIN